jgi:hypothetical protein
MYVLLHTKPHGIFLYVCNANRPWLHKTCRTASGILDSVSWYIVTYVSGPTGYTDVSGPTPCPKTTVLYYHLKLQKIPEQQRPQRRGGKGLKSPIWRTFPT